MSLKDRDVENPNMRKDWKKSLLKNVIMGLITMNLGVGLATYGLRQEGISGEKLERTSGIIYIDEKGQSRPLKDPTYWITKPGREIAYSVYDFINR